MNEYAFEIELKAAIRVKAGSEAEARALMESTLDCCDANLGAWPNGDPITCEVSLVLNEAEEASLYEVNGIALDAEGLIGISDRHALFENAQGFLIVRQADGYWQAFYGDDACERARHAFTGDEAPDDPRDNADAVEAFAEWCPADDWKPDHPLAP